MKLTLGKRQLAVVIEALQNYTPATPVATKAKEALLVKLTTEKPTPTAACTPAQIQDAVHAASGGKLPLVRKAEASYWVKAQNAIRRKDITLAEAKRLGRWLATQTWLTSPNFSMVLNKWEEWNAAAAQSEEGAVGTGSPGSRRAEAW